MIHLVVILALSFFVILAPFSVILFFVRVLFFTPMRGILKTLCKNKHNDISQTRSLHALHRGSRWRPFSTTFSIPPWTSRIWQAEILPDHLNLSELVTNWLCHEFLVTVFQDEFEDQALEGFGYVFFVISRFGFVEPISVNDKDGGKVAEQGQQGLVKGVGEFFQWVFVTQSPERGNTGRDVSHQWRPDKGTDILLCTTCRLRTHNPVKEEPKDGLRIMIKSYPAIGFRPVASPWTGISWFDRGGDVYKVQD
jgi:hypothetical protein